MGRIYLLCVGLIIFSCSKDEEHEIVRGTPPGDTLTFQKLHDMIEQAELIWPGYNYLSETGSYIILREGDGSNPHGYFLNPTTAVANESVRLSDAESDGLDLYRNDAYLKQAADILGESRLFSFNELFLDEQFYFLIRSITDEQVDFYHEYKNQNNNWLPLVMIHEAFHVYQLERWAEPDDAIQDLFGYPLTEDIISYELALMDLMVDAHRVTDEAVARDLLSRFIALYEKMISIDPTDEMIIKRVGAFEMFYEGSARYVEHYSAKSTIYPTINEDPTHGWRKFIYEMNESTADVDINIRRAFAFRIWYQTGSGVINLLKEAGVSVEEKMAAGITPYELALEEVELTAEQKAAIVAEIVSASGWDEYVQKANYLHGLLNE